MPHEAKSLRILGDRLPSIFNEVRRKKIPFEAMYPYVNVPKVGSPSIALLYLRYLRPRAGLLCDRFIRGCRRGRPS